MTITVTAVAHGLSTGDVVCLEDILWVLDSNGLQPDQLNGECFTIVRVDADTFTLHEIPVLTEFDVSSESNQPRAGMFNSDGTVFFILSNGSPLSGEGDDDPTVWQYRLTTPYDLATAGAQAGSVKIEPEETVIGIHGGFWNANGTTYNSLRGSTSVVRVIISVHAASTPYDITTLADVPTYVDGPVVRTATDKDFSSDFSRQPSGLAINADGTKVYISEGGAFDLVHEYSMSTAYDITTAGSEVSTFDTSGESAEVRGIAWSIDGTTFFVVDANGNPGKIYQYPATGAFDLSTVGAVEDTFNLVRSTTPSGRGLFWSPDCRRFYVGIAAGSGIIQQYLMPTGSTDCDLRLTEPSTGFTAYDSGGSALEQVGTITGLDHLEGEGVVGLDDGIPFTGKTVSSGSIVLESSKAQVGLAFDHEFKSLKQNAGAPSGVGIGKKKRVGEMTVALLWAAEFSYGDDLLDTLFDSTNPATNVFTGERRLKMDSGWSSDERYVFKGSKPLPWFCMAVLPEIWVNDLL